MGRASLLAALPMMVLAVSPYYSRVIIVRLVIFLYVTVVVAARCTPEKKLVLTVTDDGKGCDRVDEVVRNGGIGLRNVRERLRLMYNGDADMQISSPGGKGFIVTLTLPYQLHPGHSRERSTAP